MSKNNKGFEFYTYLISNSLLFKENLKLIVSKIIDEMWSNNLKQENVKKLVLVEKSKMS